jgi:very-short-patch-repair endonuclease
MQKSSEERNGESSVPFHLRKANADVDWRKRFRIIASKASRQNRNPLVYSSSEMPIRDELVRLGFMEGNSFFHEHRLFGYLGKNKQNVYFWLDFYLPHLKLGIEADGEIWHRFSSFRDRDKKRDLLLSQIHGIKVVRLGTYDLRRKRLPKKLMRIMEKRNRQLKYVQLKHDQTLPEIPHPYS